MPGPDQATLRNALYTRSAIQLAVTNTPATRVIPPGLWWLRCRAAECRFLQGPASISLAAAGPQPTVTNLGAAGAVTYTYNVVAVMDGGLRDSLSDRTAKSTDGTTGTGNATLTSVNKNHLVWAAVPGAVSYEIYRKTGGATQGKIGTTTALTFDDTGLAAAGAAPAASTIVGVPVPADMFFGPVYVADSSDSTFSVETVDNAVTGTMEFIEDAG